MNIPSPNTPVSPTLEPWMSFFRDRANLFGMRVAESDGAATIALPFGQSVMLRNTFGTLMSHDPIQLDLRDELSFVVFAHNLDQRLIVHTRADPTKLPAWNPWQSEALGADQTGRLRQHLWRLETRPHVRQSRIIGRYRWHELSSRSGLYAAAWSIGFLEFKLPVLNRDMLRIQALRLSRFDQMAPSGRPWYFALKRDDGQVGVLVVIVAGAIRQIWVSDEPNDHFLDAMDILKVAIANPDYVHLSLAPWDHREIRS
jgi:hypothetical protein